MRRLVTIMAALLGLCVLPIGTADASPKGKKVAYLATNPTHPFIAALSKAFVDKANSFGMEVTTLQHAVRCRAAGAAGRRRDRPQVRHHRRSVPTSEQAIVPALTRAKQAGMPVIMLNTPGEGREPRISTSSFVGEDQTCDRAG